MGRIFIIGPTVGLPKLNIDVFRAVADKLQRMGHEAVIPHNLFHEEENGMSGLSESEARMRMVDELLTCKKAVLLGDYQADPFAPALLLAARRRIMDVVPVTRLDIELNTKRTTA